MAELTEQQPALPVRFGASPDLPSDDLMVGIARSVRSGLQPVTALRHQAESGTSGWYIWAGEERSDEAEFFEPLHVSHLLEWCPVLVPYLALPPGWRVLLAPGQEDVWFDESLL